MNPRLKKANITCLLVVSRTYMAFIFRYLIWKRDDDTEVAVPPPPQLKKVVEGFGGAGAAASGDKTTAGATANGAASPLVSASNSGSLPFAPCRREEFSLACLHQSAERRLFLSGMKTI